MQLTYYKLSDKGKRRNNEDYVGSYELNNEYCFAVADGLGGHERGEVASKLVVETVGEVFAQENGYSEYFLREAFELAQQNLLDKQQKEDAYDELKTTLTLVVIGKESIGWGHVGDSRIYRFGNKKLITQTKDHSVPQMLVKMGEITEKEIRNHPDRSRLLKVMGVDWDRPKYEIVEDVPIVCGDSYLMCSDGFWELIEEKQMLNCLKKSKTPQEWIELMQEIVLENGKERNMDNYSAIAIWIRE